MQQIQFFIPKCPLVTELLIQDKKPQVSYFPHYMAL
jgi:hypothetical protein